MSDEDDIPQEAMFEQVAALPYRVSSGEVEILLITSRDSGRWLIPKGWMMKKHTGAEAAEVEAYEEAGVRGVVAQKPLGAYTYFKTLKDGAVVQCEVQVYPLAVKRQTKKFKEKGQRRQQWLSVDEAARQVSEPELATLIAAFKPKRALKP